MRAVGISKAIDYTIWFKMDLGHSSCSVLNHGFDFGKRQPVDHAKAYSIARHCIPAKLYRTGFETTSRKCDENDDQYQTFLSPFFYDATNSYYNKTTSIKFPINENTKKTLSSPIHLCIYNHRKYTPLAIGIRTDTSCNFINIVGDNVFIVSYCLEKKM